jgi:hypothetical protein
VEPGRHRVGEQQEVQLGQDEVSEPFRVGRRAAAEPPVRPERELERREDEGERGEDAEPDLPRPGRVRVVEALEPRKPLGPGQSSPST